MATTEMVKKAAGQGQLTTVNDFMEKQRALIAAVLPKTITPERMLGIFTMILKSSPVLARCSQQSLISAVIQTAQLGLQPGNIGHIHLVPFKNNGVLEVQLIIGYKGYVELVNRSGEATILTAEVVYDNDMFQYELGLNPVLKHIPAEGDRGSFRGVYCIAKNLIAQEKVAVFLDKNEVNKVRNASKAKSSEHSPWNTWFDEMAKKTAVKRISKLLPLSAETQKALSADETIKTKIDADMTSVPNEASWEDAEDAETTPSDKQNTASDKRTEPKPTPQQPSQENHAGKRLIEIPVNGTMAEGEFLVNGVELKPNVGKHGKTTYQVEDTQGQTYYIDRWGCTNQDLEGQICTFLLIKVSEYQGKRQYMADKVIVKE